MELRDIEIFLTLAEELHFGRTAERLHVSTARVSQAIKKQERAVGADLFERTSRSVRLTVVGEQLRRDLRPLFHGMHESMQRARLAARGKTGVLRVGATNSNNFELRPFWEAFRSRYPQWDLTLHFVNFVQPFVGLRNGEIDVLLTWLPIEEPDLTVGPIVFTEGRHLITALDNELAQEKSVSFEVLANHLTPTAGPAAPDYWEDSLIPFYTPRGRPLEKAVTVTSSEQILNEAAQGRILHANPRHVARFNFRPDLAYVPIHDLPDLRFGLVWRSEAEDERIRALAAVVRDVGTARL
ncbi:LysR family transcriptional regulator [Nocardia yunnanensis]|uniref:LysR family transcriptional regulator n=1 Tax=Nocardia yunnanensis TaxID=2382165 RepID=A0A386Z5G6_9NOCA|nr:LysR family transcriptional regulator [Nocardia yunnanensis]AYF72816.1 LysR family transcriptional regulator [Nocardia yunnanensis]